MDKIAIYTIIIVFVAGLGFWLAQSGLLNGVFLNSDVVATPLPEGIVLFYGKGCPHCNNVDKFIEENKIKEKINISEIEVWYNRNNAELLNKVAKMCNLKISSIGVPFAYDSNRCFVGEVDIIEFFNKLKIEVNE